MSDLIEWLLACITEDEVVAKEAQENSTGGGRWWVDGPAEKSRKFWVYATGEKFAHVQIADHIARYDPAHVLAICKAHREIVDWFLWNAEAIDGEWGDGCDVEQIRAGQCHDRHVAQSLRPLRTLATIYADRPGWREEWAS